MGEVYRAKDTRLGRDVAIKVLPSELARDEERLARFEREAKLLASLNHPQIAHVYGFESGTLPDGSTAHFLAMELVEGEDLAARLKRGRIPIEDALPIASQIAEALEEAHERGIVHRDLKPGNVKVTPAGKVKVLDFGLAKAYAGDSATGSGPDLSQSPTLAHTGTQAGVILGTAAYMSPEQARGKPVDKRSDIWAFGVVLYEMLTGRRLFEGETVTDVLAAVVRQEIDWTALPAATPGGVRRVLGRCLQRDPGERLRDIGDAHFDLEGAGPLADEAGSGRSSGDASGPRTLARRLAGTAALILLGVLAGALVVGRLDRTPSPRPVHFAAALSLGEDLLQRGSVFVLSPEGTRIVFRGSHDGREGLFLRSLDELDGRLVPGTENGTAPFFSPDGAWLAFFSVGPHARGAELMKTRLEGGAPIRVTETAGSALAGFTASGSWSEGGEVLFSGSAPVIQRVSVVGGQASAATELDDSRGEQRHVQPAWLPGGKAFLYVANMAAGRQDVMLSSGDGGRGRVLVERGTSPRYAASGHVLFAREKTLLAVAFDLRSLQATGEPFPVLEGLDVAVYGLYRTARFDLSPNGTLAYLVDRPVGRNAQLVFVDRRGQATAAFEETGTYLVPRISPDGSRVAYAAIDDQSGQRDVWIGDLKRGTRTRLTLAKGASTDPIWTPDGQGVTYASTRDQGSLALFTSPADGSREPTKLSRGAGSDGRFFFPRSWLRDGSGLLFHVIETSDDIGILRTGSGTEEMLLASPFAELEPSLSPDERHMAYVSDESGRREVFVRSLDGAARRVQVSSEGGDEPVWSPRGGEIFYRQGPRMIAVPVSVASGVSLGKPAVLFEGRYDVDPFNNDATNYDVTRDGQRFLMIRPVRDPAGSRHQLNVVVNWYEELTRLRGGPR